MNNLCLTIGVSNAARLEKLPGAIIAAKDFGFWAQQSGFKTTVITDESSIVTTEQIKDALLELLDVDDEIDLLILHFAGHGYRTGAEQHVWLPSDWIEEGCAISVEGLKRGLFGRGIRNISIFSDACRSMPQSVEMAEIKKDSLIRKGSYINDYPKIDRFNAAMDGELTYMLKGSGEVAPRCVFSTVLLEGLYGTKEEAYDQYLPNCVIPESLAIFSEKRMLEIGQIYGLTCMPEHALVAPRNRVIYLNRETSSIKPHPDIDWPPPPSEEDIVQDKKIRSYDSVTQSGSYYQSHGTGKIVGRIEESLTDTFAHEINFIIIGLKGPIRIWCSQSSKRVNERCYIVDVPMNSSTQVMVEFPGSVFMSCIIYPNLITYLSIEYYGFKGWTCFEKNTDRANISNTVNFLESFRIGEIRASDVDEVAAKLRRQKHYNPMMGAISSYLYDYTGDIDSIRRMAYFYCRSEQDIPYDIALMSMLPNFSMSDRNVKIPAVRKREVLNINLPNWVSQETEDVSGRVAGYWPWLKQGWQFTKELACEKKSFYFNLENIIPHLLELEYSAFNKIGATILINEFGLELEK